MKRLLIAALLTLALTAPIRSQTSEEIQFDADAQQGIEHVYNLEFEKAELEFGHMVLLKPHHPAGHFFLAMILWWKIQIDIDNQEYDRGFLDSLDNVITICDSMLDINKNDVTAIFFKGGAIGFEGRLKFHRGDLLGAANAGRKALPLVQTASDLDPHNYDVLLGSGIYNYYAEVIPQEYPLLKPLLLFIPPGDKKKGIEQLTLTSEKAKYASIEATYFLIQLYYYYEKDYTKALDLAIKLHSRFPDNILFHRYLGRCYVAANNWPMADQVFADIVARVHRAQRGYNTNAEREAEYYLGTDAMNMRSFDAALQHYFRCDELSRTLDKDGPSGFMVMANLKVGMVYDLQTKRELAERQYNKVLAMREYKDSHVQAEQYLKQPYVQ